YGRRQCSHGIDALLVSSAFAGGGFISTRMYKNFVQPAERKVLEGIRKPYPDVFLYVHTCGAIGDRLDLMVDAGYQGIDTLDPPPLGTVELQEAKKKLNGRCFIKGNMDSVNTLLAGDLNTVEEDVLNRLQWGAPDGGFILSSACSVAPRVAPAKLMRLQELCDRCGRYDTALSIDEQVTCYRRETAELPRAPGGSA
ncbi:MAG TPA: uroporphyrinogen decarboxylase family protein, partial [Planctomycetota bacterium]|nr:uroporphyrinogen decarboxylase family protein [Planctomycetota bacterium]